MKCAIRARQSADRRLEKSCEIAVSPDIGREAQLTRLQLAKVATGFLQIATSLSFLHWKAK